MLSQHMHLNAIKKVSENESAKCKKENDKYKSSKQYILYILLYSIFCDFLISPSFTIERNTVEKIVYAKMKILS